MKIRLRKARHAAVASREMNVGPLLESRREKEREREHSEEDERRHVLVGMKIVA